MEDHNKQWQACLVKIREQVKDQWVYDTWFAPVTLYEYDEQQNRVVLSVPDEHVYLFLEHYCVRLIAWALAACFKPGIQLGYRIQKPEPTFADIAAYFEKYGGYDSRRDPYHIHVDNARERMEEALSHYLPGGYEWQQGYDRVVDWLTDNKGRGLLVVGTPGRGKSLLCEKILPRILGNGGRPIPFVMAKEIRDRLEDLKKEPIVIIDELGKEPRKHFGDIDNAFFELCNNAERTGHLLIIATNLSTTPVQEQFRHLYPQSITECYGAEVLDRLKVVTSMTRLEGPTLRK